MSPVIAAPFMCACSSVAHVLWLPHLHVLLLWPPTRSITGLFQERESLVKEDDVSAMDEAREPAT